ncbi:MAG: carboxypeptidase M32, partial [Spirochaetales bacterium]|nr:carboxypeptidase M32 [Spirochaetales bacterium]
GGMYGYFPSYALGNIINAQIWDTMAKSIDVVSAMRSGKLSMIKDYLTQNYYRTGAIYSISDMLTKVTGRNLDSSFFDIYLRDKYRRLFG